MTFQKMGSGTPTERSGGARDRRVGRRVAEAVPPKSRAITSVPLDDMVARPRASRDRATLDDLREAVTTLEAAERIARRVLGGAHPLTVEIEHHLRKAALRARETPSPP